MNDSPAYWYLPCPQRKGLALEDLFAVLDADLDGALEIEQVSVWKVCGKGVERVWKECEKGVRRTEKGREWWRWDKHAAGLLLLLVCSS